jgi:D-galactosamine 6-phosphate deaminase/isomerase
LREQKGAPAVSLLEPGWLQALGEHQTSAAEFFAKNPAEQRRLGYFHTLREICQQPSTWMQTCELMQGWIPNLRKRTKKIRSLILTGSGSSEYAGNCVRLPLQRELGMVTQSLSGGAILTQLSGSLPPGRPGLMVSLARSGDSPESVGALTHILKTEPEIHHLVLTCNSAGSLATTFRDDRRVDVITLDEATNDQSLVMTSSFTNLVLAARVLGLLEDPTRYQAICEQASAIAGQIIGRYFDVLAAVAKAPFRRAVFLGSGARFAATREAALKMLEMTAGRVTTLCETYLGLRHGPMSYVHEDCLVVGFLSSDPSLRAYESDLLRELDRKNLSLLKVIVGEDVPCNVLRKNDVVIECKGMKEFEDNNSPVIDVLVGQLLAFFRCLEEGLLPDSPSENRIISRVVQSFTLHPPAAG